jgi:hypothetical protein
MLGHERSLVRRYQGRPFALLGVSAEEGREALQAVQRREGLSWRNCWDGRGGPISTAWAVDSFPTAYLIDAGGVIRYKHVGAPPAGLLEQEIDELLAGTGG